MPNNNNKKGQQFMPFDALKGLGEELKKQEEEKVEMPIFSEEIIEKISLQISHIQKNDEVRIKYYRNHRYYEVAGIVRNIDEVFHTITIGKTKISFETILDIYDIDSSD
jgi:hypothetical protein